MPVSRSSRVCVFDEAYFVGGSKSNYSDYHDVEAAIDAGFMPVIRRHASRAGDRKERRWYLDLGCAFGYYVERLSNLGWDAVGVDVSEYAIGRGRERGISNLCVAAAQSLPFPDEFFDFVTAIDVIEHIPPEDAVAAVAETRRVLRKGGLALFATPNFISNRYWNISMPEFEDPDTSHINYLSVDSLRSLFADFARRRIYGHTPFVDQFRAFDRSWPFEGRHFNLRPVRPVARRIAWKLFGGRIDYSSYLHVIAIK